MSAPVREEWAFGAHRARFEAPDTLWVTFDGPTTEEDVGWVTGVFREVAARQPFFAGIDISRSTIGAEARKLLINGIRPEWFLGVAYLGANLIQRTLARAIVFAVFYERQEVVAEFLPDEAAARAWFAARRAERAASRG